jgi:predicted Zn-dependent peptidase
VFRPPEIQKRTLTNGIQVFFVEIHKVPVVEVDLLVRSGGLSDPADRPGLANLAADMLDEGAGSRSALDIADEVEYLGASLSTEGGWESSSVELYVPVERLEPALDIMAEVALRPSFPQRELDRLRKERLTQLLQWRDEPRSLSAVAFRQGVFGASQRFGLPLLGTEEGLAAIGRADLERFHNTYFRPNNAALVVAGDVTPDKALPALERAFGNWSRGDIPAPAAPAARVSDGPSVTLVDRPGSAQTEIRIGALGPSRGTPEYFALTVLNTILGGSFSSRLQQNIREEHGYAYGASSRFEMYRSTGLFYAGAGVQTAVTDSALFQFMKELNAIRSPVSAEELSRAQNYVALSFPGDFETTGQLAGRVAEIYLFDLPEDYFARFIDSIRAATIDDLRRAAEKAIEPGRLEIVLVGDRSQIEANVSKLGLGPLRSLTVEDVLGKPPKV